MKLLRVFTIILGLTLITNGNLSSNEERFFSAETHIQKNTSTINSFDDLVNSFDAAILHSSPEIFMEEITSSTENN